MIHAFNPSGGKEFSFAHTHPGRPFGLYSLLYDGYRSSFPGIMQPGHGADYPSPIYHCG